MGLIDRAEYERTQAQGEYTKLPAGGYVCIIQAVRTSGTDDYGRVIDYVKEKQYAVLIYDICEGEHAGHYGDDYKDPSKDYRHRLYLGWKNLGAFKRSVMCIDESNAPGFDCFAAVDAEQWQLLIGRKFGIVLSEEEYIGNDGSVKTRFRFPTIKSAQDIRNGKFKVPELKKLQSESSTTAPEPTPFSTPAQQQPPADVYDDVPFFV